MAFDPKKGTQPTNAQHLVTSAVITAPSSLVEGTFVTNPDGTLSLIRPDFDVVGNPLTAFPVGGNARVTSAIGPTLNMTSSDGVGIVAALGPLIVNLPPIGESLGRSIQIIQVGGVATITPAGLELINGFGIPIPTSGAFQRATVTGLPGTWALTIDDPAP